VVSMHEGKRIKDLLTDRGLNVQDLATACGVTWPAAKKYIAAEMLKPQAWESAKRGLVALEIDPSLVRKDDLRKSNVLDQLPRFVGGDLRDVRDWLMADRSTREQLAKKIDDQILAEGVVELLRETEKRSLELKKRAIDEGNAENVKALDGVYSSIQEVMGRMKNIMASSMSTETSAEHDTTNRVRPSRRRAPQR
jgi:hypothetical protein